MDTSQQAMYSLFEFCKTLQNSKALLGTKVSDGMYYEVTYNGDKNECYLDAYKKWQNVCIEM